MAFAERAELIARLSLKDDFSRPLAGVQGKLSGLGSAAGRAGKAIGVGLGAGLAVGTLAISRAVQGGLSSLAELESATTSVDAAIKQMGLTGQVTAGQIATWANEIEASVGAAFDDKDITKAATTLIRFGKVTTANLRPALVVMTDLATKTGSVDSAASLLAKALADPTKAAGKLARSGVILTDAQQKQIKAMVKAGKVGQAQKVILDALAVATKGAAAASQGPYQRSLSTLKDVIEDAERALAEGFLPVIEKVRDILSTELAKPQTLANIREFGKGLASGLDSLIEIARKIPWGSIGDALKIGGAGAKIILDAFVSMPPWVQTAIATGWGLNKLTGGALSGIVGQLASGLIKGILGINAGVVNINAGVVNGAPGVPGTGGSNSILDRALTALTLALPPLLIAADTINKWNDANDPKFQPGGGGDFYGRYKPWGPFGPTENFNQGPAPVAPFTERQTSQIAAAAATQNAIETYRDESVRNRIAMETLTQEFRKGGSITALPGNANDREDRNRDVRGGPLTVTWSPSQAIQVEDRRIPNLQTAIETYRDESVRAWIRQGMVGADGVGSDPLLKDVKAGLSDVRDESARAALAQGRKTDLLKTSVTEVRDESARAKIAAAGNAQQIQNATATGSSQIVTAIRQSRPTVNVSVSVVGTSVKVTKTYSQGDMGGGPSGKYQSGENQ